MPHPRSVISFSAATTTVSTTGSAAPASAARSPANRLRPSTTEPSPYPRAPAPQVYPPIELEYPEDRVSIQTNLYRIADALARGRAERSTATALLYAMQVCQTNLGKRPLIEAPSASRPSESQDRSQRGSQNEHTDQPAGRHALRTVHRVILTPDGDEIAPPIEILEDNEAEPIHHRLCPCLLCAEKYRNQPPELHHPDCQCGLCEEARGLRAQRTERRAQRSEHRTAQPRRTPTMFVILSELSEAKAESKDLLFPTDGTESGAIP